MRFAFIQFKQRGRNTRRRADHVGRIDQLVALVRRMLREWVPTFITGFFAADLTGLSYYVNFHRNLSRLDVMRAANNVLDGRATANRVQILEADAPQFRSAAGLPAFRGSPYGQLLPQDQVITGIVNEAQGLVFGIGEKWLPIVNDSYLAGQNHLFNNIALNNGNEFTCRFRLRGENRTNISLINDLASAISAVHRRRPLLRFRVIFYNQYAQTIVAGSVNSSEIGTGRLTEPMIQAMLYVIIQKFQQDLADNEGARGSDPTVIPDTADEEVEDIDPENLLQNCSVLFIPRGALQARGPDLNHPPPSELKLIIDGTPVTLKVTDAENPIYGRGKINCVIEGVSNVLGIDVKEITCRLSNKQAYSVRQVMLNGLLPHLNHQLNHVTVDEAGEIVLDHAWPVKRNKHWLVTHRNHVYKAEMVAIQKEVKTKKTKKELKQEEEAYDFRFITLDFETRAQNWDNGPSPTTGKPTGSALAVTSAALAFRDEEGHIQTWCNTLDPDVFEQDLAKEEREVLAAMDQDAYVEKLTQLTTMDRRKLALKCYQYHNDFAKFMPKMKREKAEAYIRKYVQKNTKTVFRAGHNYKNIMKTITTRRRMIHNNAYSKSHNQPVYAMLNFMSTLPYALSHKEKNGFVNAYAHNGSGFDFFLILGPIIHLWREGALEVGKIVMKPGRIMCIEITFLTGAKYRFICTYAHLSDSLSKLCKAFDLPEELRKLDEITLPDGTVMNTMKLCLMEPDLDPCGYIRMLTEKNWLKSYEYYNVLDCVSLVYIVEQTALMYGQLLKDEPGSEGFIICQKIFSRGLSTSSVAMSFYKEFMKQFDPKMAQAFKDQSDMTEAEWLHEKKAVVGGASISNQRGIHYESLSVLDQRSQYPHALSTCVFTLGKYVDFDMRVSYVKNLNGDYICTTTQRKLKPIDYQFMPGHPCYFKSGTYVITGAFDRKNKSKYYINGLPVRKKGQPLNWYAKDIDEAQHIGWYDLNRLIFKKEFKWFTIHEDSKVAGPDCEIVEGKRLFFPFLDLLMKGKDQAERDGNKVLRTLYKLNANGFSGKLQMKIHQKKIIPEKDAIIGLYRTEPCISWSKSNVRFSVEFLGGVRIRFYDIVDSMPRTIVDDPTSGRVHLVYAETDSYGIPTELVPFLKKFIGDKLGDLVYEVDKSHRAVFFAPKTYCIEGHLNGVAIEKIAAKGLSRKLVTPEFFDRLINCENVTINMPMLARSAKTLQIRDMQHTTRTTKSSNLLPTYIHHTDVIQPGFPWAFDSLQQMSLSLSQDVERTVLPNTSSAL